MCSMENLMCLRMKEFLDLFMVFLTHSLIEIQQSDRLKWTFV